MAKTSEQYRQLQEEQRRARPLSFFQKIGGWLKNKIKRHNRNVRESFAPSDVSGVSVDWGEISQNGDARSRSNSESRRASCSSWFSEDGQAHNITQSAFTTPRVSGHQNHLPRRVPQSDPHIRHYSADTQRHRIKRAKRQAQRAHRAARPTKHPRAQVVENVGCFGRAKQSRKDRVWGKISRQVDAYNDVAKQLMRSPEDKKLLRQQRNIDQRYGRLVILWNRLQNPTPYRSRPPMSRMGVVLRTPAPRLKCR